MAKCRIYLFTYDRNGLLERAVQSLLSQTVTDWVCEVHNDMPGNNFPEQYIRSLNDKRFTVINHPINLGTTRSFNFAFKGCAEKYASMLEDDNWWEATFLEEMIIEMDSQPELNVMWSNMFVWKERIDGTWDNTGKTLWPTGTDIAFNWPQPKQAMGSLHSTGAMIYKGSNAANYCIPDDTLSNAVELVRERSFEYPIYLKAKPLANFSYTLVSSQSDDSVKWVGTQTMMLASYILNAADKKKEFKALLSNYRINDPSPVHVFLLAVIFYIKEWDLIFAFNLSDVLLTIKWLLVNLFNLKPLRSYLRSQQQTWLFLKERTLNFTDSGYSYDPIQ